MNEQRERLASRYATPPFSTRRRVSVQRIGWLGLAVCLGPILVVLLAAGHPTCAADHTNILVLYSDDAGYADFGFQPDCMPDMKQLTPHIDSLAAQGARFSNAYMTGCVCSPSRAGLMTGRYQQRFGFDNNLPPGTRNGLDLKETFGAERMKTLGYTTGLIGKWHLGYPPAFHPNRRGFDAFFGLIQGSRPYYPMTSPTPFRVLQNNGKPTPESGYVTDRLGDAACAFINEHGSKPFFLFVSFTAPHGPNQPRPSDARRTAHIADGKRQSYAGLVVALDDNVGKILKCLDTNGLTRNTLVVFTNDNGGQVNGGANNTPLKGRKGQLAEGGIRVPFAIRWPEHTPPKTTIDQPVIALDLLPTMLALAGAQIDPAWNLDGRSLLPLIDSKTAIPTNERTWPERSLFWRQHGESGERAMRKGRWKLHHDRTAQAPPRLYDLQVDVGETKDLAEVHPDRLAGMLEELNQWESQLVAPRWGKDGPQNKRGKRNKRIRENE